MLEKRRRRMNEIHMAELIADSFNVDDIYDWTHAPNINCYAFARGLTYPDVNQRYYAPGKIHQLMFGTGDITISETNPDYIDKCIQNDSIALNQEVEKVNFKDISPTDGQFYFAICNFKMKDNEDIKHWHFICRTPTNLWLHKPNWAQDVQAVNWIKDGQTFTFADATVGIPFMEFQPDPANADLNFLPCLGVCFEDYFYKLKLPE